LLYFCLFLFDWGWNEFPTPIILFWDPKPLLSPPPGGPLFGPISCHMFFPIILHTFSHSTSETLLCVLGGLGVICWCYFLYILLSVVWPGLGQKGWHLDLNWLICIKLGLSSCQLWYQRPSWVLTLLTKWDSGFIALIFFISKFVSSYLPPPPVITHFLLSPSTISHLQLLLPPSSTREIPHQHSIFLSCLLHEMLHLILTCLF
jgi:hypothetical protein